MKRDWDGIKAKAREMYDSIERAVRDEIDDERNEQAPIRRIIMAYSAAAAGASINPLPLSGLALVTPIHVALVLHVGKRLGHPLTIENAGEVFKELVGAVGLSIASRLTTGALLKIGLPLIGGLLRAPVVFALTYGLGRVAEDYFLRREKGLTFDKRTAREVFAKGVAEGRVEGAYADYIKRDAKRKNPASQPAAKEPVKKPAKKPVKKPAKKPAKKS